MKEALDKNVKEVHTHKGATGIRFLTGHLHTEKILV
jgi:hypothetical protein